MLNHDIEFHKLDLSIRDSFLRGRAKKRLFRAGTQLVRVVSIGYTSFNGSFCIRQAYFEHIKNYAETRKMTLQSAFRERLALLKKFSPSPDLAVTVTLGADMYGFVGLANSQTDHKTTEYYSGGSEQIFIPNLSKERSNKFGLLHRF